MLRKNLALATIVTAPSPATTGLSLVVDTGEAARFPVPATDGDFYATLFPANEIPHIGNSEIVKVTAVSTDTFTIVRAQRGSTAKTVEAGWLMIQGIYAEDFDDLATKAYADLMGEGVNRQAIINGGFTVNQRGYTSGATLAAGKYGHDRWKAGANGGDYSFTQLAQSTQITIASGKSLIQVIEDKNVVGGTYTLSWEGTAQARAGVDSATPSGAYAASPLTIENQTAGTVMSVEFNEGTLGKVQLNVGSVALPFQPKSYEDELAACLRYYFRTDAIASGRIGVGLAISTTDAEVMVTLPVPMRVPPSAVDTSGTAGDYSIRNGTGVTTCSSTPSFNSATNSIVLVLFKVSSGLTTGQMVFGRSVNTSGYLGFDAEL